MARGFTLIELLVVLAIVALLLSVAAPRYFQRVDVAREAVLAENLRLTRQAIDQFRGDTGRYPDSLQELVARRYLRNLPVDPVAHNAAAWTLLPPAPPAQGAVADLRSRAPGIGRDGRPYAAW